jgi:hypothetical protein
MILGEMIETLRPGQAARRSREVAEAAPAG